MTAAAILKITFLAITWPLLHTFAHLLGLRWENIVTLVSFPYPIKTWVWRCHVWFCPQVLPPYVGPNPKPSSTYMSGCFPNIPGHIKLACRDEWNASLSETQKAFVRILSGSNMYNPVRSCIFSSQFTKFFDKNPNDIRPLGLHVSGDLSDIGFTQKNNLQGAANKSNPLPCFVNISTTNRNFYQKFYTTIYHSYLRVTAELY